MKVTRSDYARALEIYPWQERTPSSSCHTANITQTSPLTLEVLKKTVANCTACALHQTRTHTVFGEGNTSANIMFIGEAPGFNEDQQGKPFVGKAGQLLTAMLKAINFTREEIFIANVLKCRPPNNRDPLPDEIKLCTNYLNQQINLIKPNLLVALGRIAAHYLLQTKTSLESMRQKQHVFGEAQTPLIVTYHPAYLLRNPADKRKAYQDLLMIRATFDELIIHHNK